MKRMVLGVLFVGIGVALAAGLRVGAQGNGGAFHFVPNSLVLTRSVYMGDGGIPGRGVRAK